MNIKNNMYSVFVNSSDGFEDCWIPFFTLLKKYWPNCHYTIYLNTEKKEFVFDGLNIISTKVQKNENRKLTWSECLIKGLKAVDTPIILYFQEDYFIKSPVNVDLIEDFVGIMLKMNHVKHIGLTPFGSRGGFKHTFDNRLWEIKQNARYRISTQAGLWYKDVLENYLVPKESGWMFEINGTKRAQNRNDFFCTVNRDIYGKDKNLIIDYILTGIVKGKWHPDIPALFELHGIIIHYENRGMLFTKFKMIDRINLFKKRLFFFLKNRFNS